MQCSDAIVTRGGTTTCAKALHFRCPIIFNGFGGIMPQESLTWKFFHNGAKSAVVSDAGEFASIVDQWMSDPTAYAKYRSDFLGLRYEEDPTVLIDELVGLAWQAGGGTLNRLPYPPRPVNGTGGTKDPRGLA